MPTINRQGIPISYDVTGQGPVVVMTHSFLCDRQLFRHQARVLGHQHRVINIDLRGHGQSGDSLQPFSVYDLTDDVLAVLDAEGVPSAVWLGLSIGGFLSLRAALRHPQRVAALVLIDTDAGPESAWKRFKYGVLSRALATLGPRPVVPMLLPIFFGRTSLRQRRGLVDGVRRQFQAMRVPSIRQGITTICERDDLRADLPRISCPTLVIVGDEDQPLPVPRSRLIADRIPGAELAVIPHAGHLSAIETPEAVTGVVLEFLSRQVRRAPAAGGRAA